MNKLILITTTLIFAFTQHLFACHNSTIDNVVAVNNGNGTTTYTIDFSVDVGSLDGYSLGFAFVFQSSTGTPTVLSSPAYTPSVSRSGYNDLVAYTGATIGSGLGAANASNYFDDRYGGRTDVITYETDDDFWGFGSTDYSNTITVTVQGCVEEIVLDADFRTTGSATPAGSASCLITYSTGVTCAAPCAITAITAGTQTACNPSDNTYTQQVTITYSDAPATGTLQVNGTAFAITSSPQTVTLTGLNSDGNTVDVSAVFSDDASCSMTVLGLFTAPVSCSATPCTPDNGTWD